MIGIYKIANRKNGWSYIGSSKSIENRWKQHISELEEKKHHCYRLQYDWDKYGICEFDFSVLEICDEEILIQREQYYIDQNYNEGMIYNTKLKLYKDKEVKHNECKINFNSCSDDRIIFPSKNIFRFDDLHTQRIFFMIMKQAISTDSKYIEISVLDYIKTINLNGNTYYDKFEELKVKLENLKIDNKKVFKSCDFDRKILVVVINDFIFDNVRNGNVVQINFELKDILKFKTPKTLALLLKIGNSNSIEIGFDKLKELTGVSDKYEKYSKFKGGVLKSIEKDLNRIECKLETKEFRTGREIEKVRISVYKK